MQKRILVTALNWGLGHASRSIPVIRNLLAQGVEVFLGADGRAAKLWAAEFPDLPLTELPDYNIQYPSSNLTWQLGKQLPNIWNAIRRENKVTRELVRKWDIQGIISDHRYGCYHPQIPSVLLCHQMKILAPNALSQLLINGAHRYYLKNFDWHWVPDTPAPPGLAGELSHGYETSKTVFIGPLSRFERKTREITTDYLVVLSGPEPQRTNLETELLEAAQKIPGNWFFVGGKTEQRVEKQMSDRIYYCDFMTSQALESAMQSSKTIICRSGYSSMMDLKVLDKPAILIPTPGQTEQEYLAQLHQSDPQFVLARQDDLDLESKLKAFAERPKRAGDSKEDLLGTAIQEFLEICPTN